MALYNSFKIKFDLIDGVAEAKRSVSESRNQIGAPGEIRHSSKRRSSHTTEDPIDTSRVGVISGAR